LQRPEEVSRPQVTSHPLAVAVVSAVSVPPEVDQADAPDLRRCPLDLEGVLVVP
jgi:hypothetical protein